MLMLLTLVTAVNDPAEARTHLSAGCEQHALAMPANVIYVPEQPVAHQAAEPNRT